MLHDLEGIESVAPWTPSEGLEGRQKSLVKRLGKHPVT